MMKIILHLFALCASVVICDSTECGGIASDIAVANTLLSTEGPTTAVLNNFDNVAKSIEENENAIKKCDSIISDVTSFFYKKALIELGLNKELLAVADLRKVLEIDTKQEPAKRRLAELFLNKGDFESLNGIFLEPSAEIEDKKRKFHDSLARAELLFSKNEFESCVNELTGNALGVSPASTKALLMRFKCADRAYKREVKFEDHDPYRVAIRDLAEVVKISPIQELDVYRTISDYLLFTETQFEKARAYIKNCLRIDNDFKLCGASSKFLTKFQDFLKILEEYSIIIGHYYLVDQEPQSAAKEIEYDVKFDYVNKFLFNDAIKVSKIDMKKLPRGVNTNYDYLIYKVAEFLRADSSSKLKIEDVKLVQDLNMIACESYMRQGGSKSGSKYCNIVKSDSFFPKFLPKIDKLLANRNYGEAKRVLDSFHKQVKQSPLFIERYSKVESHFQKQKQQRERHKQQQQQHRYFNHQHYQQPKPPTAKPAKDYYKILDIARDADDRTIKKAYRTQTLKYHPDKFKGTNMTPEESEKKMQDVNQAYEVLSNKELRERYDRGEDPNDPLGGQSQQQHNHPFGSGNAGGNGGFQFNFGEDFLRQFMGQQRGSSGGFKFGGFGDSSKGRARRGRTNRRS